MRCLPRPLLRLGPDLRRGVPAAAPRAPGQRVERGRAEPLHRLLRPARARRQPVAGRPRQRGPGPGPQVPGEMSESDVLWGPIVQFIHCWCQGPLDTLHLVNDKLFNDGGTKDFRVSVSLSPSGPWTQVSLPHFLNQNFQKAAVSVYVSCFTL